MTWVRVDLASAQELVNPKRDVLVVSPYNPLRVAPGDVGIDLPARRRVEVAGFYPVRVPTGVKVVLPYGVAGFVSRRSGMKGFVIGNSPGIIDPAYRGEIEVEMVLVDKAVAIENGMESLPFDGVAIPEGWRIAQLSLVKVIMPLLGDVLLAGCIYYSEDEELYHRLAEVFPTERGKGGFGHTGRY